MRQMIVLATFLYLPYLAQSQDSIKSIIEKVFYQEEIFNLVFFDYKEMNDTPFPLPETKLAFIIPDSTFQKLYPNILFELASGWGRERMMHTKTYIRGNNGSVLVNNGFRMNHSMRLFIRIMNIQIEGNKAFLEFNTTRRFQNDNVKERYVSVKAHLKMKRGQWKISSLSISDYPWQGYMFPEDESFDERRDKNSQKR